VGALYSRSRVFSVAVTLFFVLFNAYTIFMNWYVILNSPEQQQFFMLLIDRHAPQAAERFKEMQLAVTSVELLAVVGMMLYSLYIVMRYNFCATEAELKQYRMWHQLYNVCCEIIPRMSNFSAMKSLQFLNPQVLGTALSIELTKVEEGKSHLRVITCFVLTRLVLGALGFVAFSIKLTHLVTQLWQLLNENQSGFLLYESQVMLLFGFVNQAFGITQISQVETSRLFLFIFGGEDSAMQAGELDRQEAYLACVAYTVCTGLSPELPPFRRRLRRAAALMSFTHLDIQSLVLDEDESQEVDARTLRDSVQLEQSVITSGAKEQRRRPSKESQSASFISATSIELSSSPSAAVGSCSPLEP
jgi:hypothetical protein